jgi:hypothetical protein
MPNAVPARTGLASVNEQQTSTATILGGGYRIFVVCSLQRVFDQKSSDDSLYAEIEESLKEREYGVYPK